MTRTVAIFLSYFGPIIPLFLLLPAFAAFDREPPRIVVVLGMILFVAAAVAIRVYFAAWYARDKGRSGALGFIALFGLLGWVFLLLTEDRKAAVSAAPIEVAPSVAR